MGVKDQVGRLGSALWRGDVGVLVSVVYWSWLVGARGEVDVDADADTEAVLYRNDIASLLPLCPFSANLVS